MSTTIMGNNYHTYCLTCSNCGKPLWNKPFRQTKEGLFCDGDCEAENNFMADSQQQQQQLVLPPIALAQQQRQPLKVNQDNTYGKSPVYGKEDSVSNLIKQHDYVAPNSIYLYNATNTSRPIVVESQQPPTRSTPPPPPLPLAPPLMPRANEQIEIYSMMPHNNNNNNKQESNGVKPLAQPIYQYNVMDAAGLPTERQNTSNLISMDTIGRQNSFLSVHRHRNPLNGSQTSINLMGTKPYTDYLTYYEAPALEKELNHGATFICSRCNKRIAKDMCSFNERHYHQNCFRCLSCNIELYNMKKVLTDQNEQGYYCEPCYAKNFGPRCGKCNEPVTPHMLSTNYHGTLFHRECLSCARCKKPLAELEFKKSGKIYICRNCY